MASFTDSAGRTWRVVITVAELLRVKRDADLDLLEILERPAELAGDLERHPDRLAAALLALLADQLTREQLSADAFLGALREAECQAAVAAILEALELFCASPARRAFLRKLTETQAALRSQAEAQAASAVAALPPAATLAAEALVKMQTPSPPPASPPPPPGNSSIAPPDSAGLTPPPGP